MAVAIQVFLDLTRESQITSDMRWYELVGQ